MKPLCCVIFLLFALSGFASEAVPHTEFNNAAQKFIDAYRTGKPSDTAFEELSKHNKQKAELLKKAAEHVDAIFHEVLKTEKQLVPKQCNYLIVYGYDGTGVSAEDLKKGCDNLRLAAFANMDRPAMKIYLAGSGKTIAAFKEALSRTPMPEARIVSIPCKTNREAAEKAISAVIADFTENRYAADNILYRRILLLTGARNTRKGYAAFVAALQENLDTMILDTFSSLDIPRNILARPSKEERTAAFQELLR